MIRSSITLVAIFIVVAAATSAQTAAPSPQSQSAPAASQNTTPQSPELVEADRLSEQVARLYAARRYDEALPRAQRVVQIRERLLGDRHQSLGVALFNLAAVIAGKRDFYGAERLYRRALAIYERNLPANDLRIATVLDNLGLVCLAQGVHEPAASAYRRALAIREATFGAQDINVARSVLNLARVYHAWRRVERAEELYRRAVAIREARLGANHPDVAEVLEYMAVLFRQEERGEEAARLESRAYLIRYPHIAIGGAQPEEIEGQVLAERAIVRADPEYPPQARETRARGTVNVEIVVDESGRVESARAISGPGVLRGPAERAARQWRFTPMRRAGVPVKTRGTISFIFAL
jgi:TonB family protein